MRCIVTGQTASGKSVFVKTSAVEPITLAALPGFEFYRLWGTDAVPQLPCDGTADVPAAYFPPRLGFRFGFFALPPDGHGITAETDMMATVAELQQKLPGLAEVLEPANPGMHTSDTVDFDVVISGQCYLELDDGAEVLLRAGDCVVQNGTRHLWRNRSSENCLIAVALIGAERT